MTYNLREDLDYVLVHTQGIWEALGGQRIFITGGTGFVGTWIVETLIHANERLKLNTRAVLLTRNPDAFRQKVPEAANHPSIEFLTGEAHSFAYPDGEFPFIIHAATERSVPATPDRPVATFDRDLEGTRHVLEFARTHATDRFLFTSSGAAYGKQPSEISHLSEDYAGAPFTFDTNSAYGQAKHASEFVCSMYAKQFGFAAVNARLFAFSGPHLPIDLNFAIGNFVRDVLKGGPVRIGGDGTPYRSYLYAADLAVWLWRLLLRGESGRIYNVGSARAISIADLAKIVVENTVPGTAIEIASKPVRGAAPARYVPSVERARTEQGLEPLVSLEEGIQKMYQWNRARWRTCGS